MGDRELKAFNIRRLVRNPDYAKLELLIAINETPPRGRFSLAGQDLIKAIHAIPRRLQRDRALNEIELYIGRAGATPGHVIDRWKEHRDEKEHRYGMVVFRCDTDVVKAWESAANKVVKRLTDDGRLCVKNARADPGGILPNEPLSCVYVTWKATGPKNLEPCDRRTVETVAHDIAQETRHLEPSIQHDQLLNAIGSLSRPERDFGEVAWHYFHDPDSGIDVD